MLFEIWGAGGSIAWVVGERLLLFAGTCSNFQGPMYTRSLFVTRLGTLTHTPVVYMDNCGAFS